MVMTIDAPSVVTLRRDQADTYDVLAYELDRIDRLEGHRRTEAFKRIDELGVDLYRHCVKLESALKVEDLRLRSLSDDDHIGNARWIKNLKRLEMMEILLNRAEAAMPRVTP